MGEGKSIQPLSGLYLHIPFCRTKCSYCDFFSVTSLRRKEQVIQAIVKEIRQEAAFLSSFDGEEPSKKKSGFDVNELILEGKKPRLSTIYVGGGTPSLLDETDWSRLFETIEASFDDSACEEITLEANPDDLTPEYLRMLRHWPFNRISIGIQSFIAEELAAIGRRHDAAQAIRAVYDCQAVGFDNISIDLMYGLPGQTPERFRVSVEQAVQLPVKHISTYALSWEEGSMLYAQLKRGKLTQASDDSLAACYQWLNEILPAHGFQRYELSNFAQAGYESKHNTGYWLGKAYLGVGPSAHSYNGRLRRWNVSRIDAYVQGIESGQPQREEEWLDEQTKYNDYVMTRLRTTQGINLKELEEQFGASLTVSCLKQADRNLQANLLKSEGGYLSLTDKGLFLADAIITDLIKI
jgi:oxygen-independent coproporphyrinogen-3 oxidase